MLNAAAIIAPPELPKKKVVVKKIQPPEKPVLQQPIELPKKKVVVKKTLAAEPPQSKLEEYNTFIKSQREEISKLHPTLTKAQTLEMARASYKASKASKITSCAPPTL
jgi:hypothetical protein